MGTITASNDIFDIKSISWRIVAEQSPWVLPQSVFPWPAGPREHQNAFGKWLVKEGRLWDSEEGAGASYVKYALSILIQDTHDL